MTYSRMYELAAKITDPKKKEEMLLRISDRQRQDELAQQGFKDREAEKASVEAGSQAVSGVLESKPVRFARGAFEGAQNTTAGLLSLGAGLVGAKDTARKFREEQAVIGGRVESLGTAAKVGFGAEQIGEFFVPGGAATKVGKTKGFVRAAEKAQKALKLKPTSFLGRRVGGLVREGVPLVAGESILGKAQDPNTTFAKEALFSAGFLALLPPSVRKTISKEKGIAQEFLERGKGTLDEITQISKKAETPRIKGEFQPDIADFKQTSIPSVQSKIPLARRGVSVLDRASGGIDVPKIDQKAFESAAEAFKPQNFIRTSTGDIGKFIKETTKDIENFSKLESSQLGILDKLATLKNELTINPENFQKEEFDLINSQVDEFVRNFSEKKIDENIAAETISFLGAQGERLNNPELQKIEPVQISDFIEKHFLNDEQAITKIAGEAAGRQELSNAASEAGDFIAPPKESPTGSFEDIPETIIDQKIPDSGAKKDPLSDVADPKIAPEGGKIKTIELNDSNTKKLARVGDEISATASKNIEENIYQKAAKTNIGKKIIATKEGLESIIQTTLGRVKQYSNKKTGETLLNTVNKFNESETKVLSALKNDDFFKLKKIPDNIAQKAAQLIEGGVNIDTIEDAAVKEAVELQKKLAKEAGKILMETPNMLKADGSAFKLKENFVPVRLKRMQELSDVELEKYIGDVADLNEISPREAAKRLEKLKYDESVTSFSGSVGYSKTELKLPKEEIPIFQAWDQYIDGISNHIARVEGFGMTPKKGKYVLEGLNNSLAGMVDNAVDKERAMDGIRAYTGERTSRYFQMLDKEKQLEVMGPYIKAEAVSKAANTAANLKLGLGSAILDITTLPARLLTNQGLVATTSAFMEAFSKDAKSLKKLSKSIDLLNINKTYARDGEAGVAEGLLKRGMDQYFKWTGMEATQKIAAKANSIVALSRVKSLVKKAQKSLIKGKGVDEGTIKLLTEQFAFTNDEIENIMQIDRFSYIKAAAYNTAANVQGIKGGNIVTAHNNGAVGAAFYKFMRFALMQSGQTFNVIKADPKTLVSAPIYLAGLGWGFSALSEKAEEQGGLIGSTAKFAREKVSGKKNMTKEDGVMDYFYDQFASMTGADMIMGKVLGNEYTRSPKDIMANLLGSYSIGYSTVYNVAGDISEGASWKEYAKQIGLSRDGLKILDGLKSKDIKERLKESGKIGDGGLEKRTYDYYKLMQEESRKMSDEERMKKGDPTTKFLNELVMIDPAAYKTIVKRDLAQMGVDFGFESPEFQNAMENENYTKAQKKSTYKKSYQLMAEQEGVTFEEYMYELFKKTGNTLDTALEFRKEGLINDKQLEYVSKKVSG